jgi:hypothetical protein
LATEHASDHEQRFDAVAILDVPVGNAWPIGHASFPVRRRIHFHVDREYAVRSTTFAGPIAFV